MRTVSRVVVVMLVTTFATLAVPWEGAADEVDSEKLTQVHPVSSSATEFGWIATAVVAVPRCPNRA